MLTSISTRISYWTLRDSVLADPDTYLALVCEVEGVQVGFCAAYVVSHFFGHDLTSGDFAVYVLPEHRKGMAGVKLIKGYLEWCESKGVKEPYAWRVGRDYAGADRQAIRAHWDSQRNMRFTKSPVSVTKRPHCIFYVTGRLCSWAVCSQVRNSHQ